MNVPRPLRILIVDDDQAMNNEVYARLTKAGFIPDQAFDGDGALQKISLPFDLIILDLVMPGVSGFDVLKKIQSRNITTPVVVLSTLRQEEDIERVKNLGARECFAKADPNFMDNVVKYAEALSVA
jgi:DNA-binding response OmpR family regulator